MWATGYDHEQACVTQSQPFELGCYGEESDHFINFMSVPALPTQWWYPEDSGAGWDRAYSEGQYSPSPPSESTDRGLSRWRPCSLRLVLLYCSWQFDTHLARSDTSRM